MLHLWYFSENIRTCDYCSNKVENFNLLLPNVYFFVLPEGPLTRVLWHPLWNHLSILPSFFLFLEVRDGCIYFRWDPCGLWSCIWSHIHCSKRFYSLIWGGIKLKSFRLMLWNIRVLGQGGSFNHTLPLFPVVLWASEESSSGKLVFQDTVILLLIPF